MNLDWLKRWMPRSLYGRAALILVVPVVVLVLLVSVVFIQRHFEDVTQQLTYSVVLELREIVEQIDSAPSLAAGIDRVQPVVDTLAIHVSEGDSLKSGDERQFYDVSGRKIISTMRDGLAGVRAIDLLSSSREMAVQIDTSRGVIEVTVDRQRLSASNPHQFLVLMVTIGALMTAIAFLYLRNQLRPITRLAEAAEAFGKGRAVRYRPGGALEVRAAGRAFLDMRGRILRQIEQRTMMLSGVSHDLRTPITRMKLTLSLMEPSPEVDDLKRDVDDMADLINAFLDFARSDKLGDPEPAVPTDIVRSVVDKAVRGGGDVTFVKPDDEQANAPVVLFTGAVERALGNLVGNALRYGKRAEVSVTTSPRSLIFLVEDDGPGIPEGDRERSLEPFTRLDSARNQDDGMGVGLGLTIASDIARRHGGVLRLSDSARLGGLKAELVLAR